MTDSVARALSTLTATQEQLVAVLETLSVSSDDMKVRFFRFFKKIFLIFSRVCSSGQVGPFQTELRSLATEVRRLEARNDALLEHVMAAHAAERAQILANVSFCSSKVLNSEAFSEIFNQFAHFPGASAALDRLQDAAAPAGGSTREGTPFGSFRIIPHWV